jgi:Flp pilus assembly protein TadG
VRDLIRNKSASAAVEMALSLPLLLLLICGSVEMGNYFMDEHRLIKAVRDGARYAARQDLTYFTGCSGTPGGTVATDTQNVVMTGLITGGDDLLPNRSTATIDVTIVGCSTSVNGTQLSGFYANVKNSSGTVVGAPVVQVEASIPYTSVLHSLGFSHYNVTLNASQQAAVVGW